MRLRFFGARLQLVQSRGEGATGPSFYDYAPGMRPLAMFFSNHVSISEPTRLRRSLGERGPAGALSFSLAVAYAPACSCIVPVSSHVWVAASAQGQAATSEEKPLRENKSVVWCRSVLLAYEQAPSPSTQTWQRSRGGAPAPEHPRREGKEDNDATTAENFVFSSRTA